MRIALREKFLIPTIIIFLIGISISSTISYMTSRNALESTINDQILQLAESITANLSAWIERNRLDIIRWSRQDIFLDAIPESFMGKAARRAANSILARIKSEYGFYQVILVADMQGRVIAASSEDLVGMDIEKQPGYYFAHNGKVHVSEVVRSDSSGVPVFSISAPIADQEKIIGVIVAKIDLSYFNSIYVDPAQLGASSYAYIVDSRGIVIAHPDKAKIFALDLSRFEYGREILKKKNGIVRHDRNGLPTINAIKQYPQLGWIVGVNAPVEELFLSANRVRKLVLITSVLIVLLISVTVTLIITKTVTSPISKFVHSMETVAKGNLDQEIHIHTADEFSLMAGAFNRMARSLRESEEKLKNTYRQLAQNERMAALGELTARIAHEIKNPLGIIKGSAQILVDQKESQEIKNEVGYFIIDEVNDLSIRIQELLSHASPMPPMLELLDINQIVEERICFWESQQRSLHKMLIQRVFDENLPLIICDAKLMRQLTLNLIINAAEAMPKDGCLTIRTAAERDASTNKQGVRMDFSDTGTGIAEDVVNKIFDPFFTTKEKGTGLGLSAVFRIMEKHKGKVSVTSKLAEGTCFHIWLPVNPDDGEVQDA